MLCQEIYNIDSVEGHWKEGQLKRVCRARCVASPAYKARLLTNVLITHITGTRLPTSHCLQLCVLLLQYHVII